MTCSVHLVELCGTDHQFAMKAMDKGVMLNRNKVKTDFSFYFPMYAYTQLEYFPIS